MLLPNGVKSKPKGPDEVAPNNFSVDPKFSCPGPNFSSNLLIDVRALFTTPLSFAVVEVPVVTTTYSRAEILTVTLRRYQFTQPYLTIRSPTIQ